ncbi:ribonucleoside-diphosphate reductase class Ib glutaredoxin subunit [Mycobacteroides abscessus subsp. abscessus]|uniref:glutaredoxin domain-containing protein n=1 Tax=Mycobacteroides abscessus TaxID=36809 RepID=UPI00044767A3|nr:glutaredoxin domain-containing protein [Mycobacteroides abscessus]QSM04342.1 NrdH-like glutaredoxin [Mycobacterium phage prophiGD43A-4]ETZ60903.1 glutaredoxin family protein [Mycobacteroides abscessus MAB_110811_2726]EUA84274.1 glutaredoxin family protein [Mycobacteroides abscessus]MDM1914035.1 glutaredoxin domain-containing protein [Mycobacteroides abscessus]MDM1926369.1 glutaredoxin domain-containing protein [Mycobacteroides abscessus]
MIQVFGKPDCPGCEQVKKLLDREGAVYEYYDVTASDWALCVLKEHGVKQVPLVLSWTHQPIVGFKPDVIKQVVRAYEQSAPSGASPLTYDQEER